ncbi:hypothetical protein CPB84DRAFT_1794546 [Gymnopilus junonius]|uniref:Isomerase YbhE n=1 Tax=Gymnopilus junonius TaxID=109634 RepID=A0A9P5TGE4_GYMJU|nr:hypothetical protein CPB84DRAFT_1794546 [Gymnopilus junonius]
MVNFTILAGGFSTFVATYQTTTGDNPSWIASHPQNISVLYAVNENYPVGSLQSFLMNPDGGLTLADTVTSRGAGPTFTNPLSTGEVTAMNFGSPNCSLVATMPNDPLHFQTDSPVVEFPVNGGPSNPHMSLEHKEEVLVSDFVHGILFVVNELTSTLTAQHIPEAPNGTTLPLIANVSIIPEDFKSKSSFAGAEILISKPTQKFPDSLIYVSNRNTGPNFDPRGDSIAIFEFASSSPILRAHARQWQIREDDTPQPVGPTAQAQVSGDLILQTQVFTGLRQIRSMTLGRVDDGGDEYLIAGANLDGGVAMFRRVDGGHNLTLVARNTEVANRTSFVFV